MATPHPLRQSSPAPPAAVEPAARPRLALLRARRTVGLQLQGFRHVLVLAVIASLAIAVLILVGMSGWTYYRLPLATRAYAPLHRLLRPSGLVGQGLGMAGVTLMLSMQLYSLRKRWAWLARFGSLQHWLEFHIFCGVVGPVLVTFHSAFKFNGVVGVGYFSMLAVVVSGFIGRYLYVRIPKTIRGRELTFEELEQRTQELKRELVETTLPVELLLRVEAFEAQVVPAARQEPTWGGLLFGELRLRWGLRRLRREIAASGFDPALLREAVQMVAERAVLLLRITHLRKTRRLFELWHVFHRPFAYLLLVVLLVHVGVGLYFGYVGLRM